MKEHHVVLTKGTHFEKYWPQGEVKQKTQSKTEQEPSGETGQKHHKSESAGHIQLGTLASQPPATSSPPHEQEE